MMKKFLFSIIIIISLLLIVGSFTQRNDHVNAEQRKNATLYPSNSSNQAQINALKTAIPNVKDKELKKNLKEKLDSRIAILEIQNQAKGNVPTKQAPLCTKQKNNLLGIEIPSGIFSGRQTFFDSSFHLFQNMWQGYINGHLFQVFAGSSEEDPNTGVLIVWVEEVNSFQRIADPNPDGALSIQSIHPNYKLELLTANGNIRYFDILAQAFIDNLAINLPPFDLPEKETVFDPCSIPSE